jgi:3-oxoacyl-[acyl-carrier protein] reductase
VTVLVTGGSAGIGAVLCAALSAKGETVVSLDRQPPARSLPGLTWVEVDLLDPAATEETARRVASEHAVTRFVHNAGIIRPNLLPAVASEDLGALTQLHLGSALILMQAILPGMQDRRFGRVVLMSSRAALGAPTRTAYAATKAGLIGMGRTWALELAPRGITVNLVAPGPVQGTPMFHSVIPAGGAEEAALAAGVPMGRLAVPADVVHAVLFFLSQEAGFITGQTLYVCGGLTIGARP